MASAVSDVEGRADDLCPVQIHVYEPMIRERRRQASEAEEAKRRRKPRRAEERERKWIDLDENVLDGQILIDDGYPEPGVLPDETEEAVYPDGATDADDADEEDADSHGRDESTMYNRMRRGAARKAREDFDLCTTYPLANSHGNAYQDSCSHGRYSEVYSEISARNYLEANREDPGNYSVANSHGDHGVSSENRERTFRENAETDQLKWDIKQQTNYEVANSHSNYRVFYDSRTRQGELLQASGWPIQSWREDTPPRSRVSPSDEKKRKTESGAIDDAETKIAGTEGSSGSNQGTEPACDIEQCLVQIEESLMNIEQNLLHVQDLDIPELRNLLYKSPSIEKSLYEVQDLLYADNIAPVVNTGKSLSLESGEEGEGEEDEEDEEEEDEEEVWINRNLTIKDNDDDDGDAGAAPFDASNEESSDTANVEENNRSESTDDRSHIDCVDGTTTFGEEAVNSSHSGKMNFVPNSLGKTLPRRILLDETTDNIRLCSSRSKEHATIDYNLNSMCAEKKLFCRDKCHSRTNSLDENSTFQNMNNTSKRGTGKCSLRDLSFESTKNSLDTGSKAKSEGTLQAPRDKCARSKLDNGHDEHRWDAVKGKDFRKRTESISRNRRYPPSASDHQKRAKKETAESATIRSRERSPTRPRCNVISTDRSQDNDKESTGGKSFEKRKRKKTSSRTQSSSENALVPSKLISLSLSLLLAALLQAVRCLTDLVEDAFRSVSYDRSGLLQ